MVLSVNLNVSTFGTKLSISSVTRQPLKTLIFQKKIIQKQNKYLPFKLRTHFSSKFLNIESSFKSKSSGIVENDNRANNISS
jgi:hypothetical protein